MGNWRSWLARFLDMEKVTGSNPVLPTRLEKSRGSGFLRLHLHDHRSGNKIMNGASARIR